MKSTIGTIVVVMQKEPQQKVEVKFSNMNLVDAVVALSVTVDRLASLVEMPVDKVLELISTGAMKGASNGR